MVAPFCNSLEWLQLHPQLHAKPHNCFRHIWGLGLWSSFQTTALAWSKEWKRLDIMAKELAPIVLSYAIWGPLLAGSGVEFHCDNSSVVDSVTKGSSKEVMVMHLLRCLWFFSAHFDIRISARYIQHCRRPAVQEQIIRIPKAEPSCFLLLHINPNFIAKGDISGETRLDFPILCMLLQTYCQCTPRASTCETKHQHTIKDHATLLLTIYLLIIANVIWLYCC